MKILVTGANGQVGSELKRQSLLREMDLIALDKSSLDITNINSIKANVDIFKPEIIINAAAYTNVDKAEEEKGDCFRVNSKGPGLLADICRQRSILLIHISTDYVFDGESSKNYIEKDRTSPLNAYGESKLRGEKVIQSILDSYIILRTSWVFGLEGNNFVKKILELLSKQNSLEVVNDQYGNPTSARSIASIILQLCKKYKEEGFEFGVYHYCNSPKTSWYSFSKEIMSLSSELGLTEGEINIRPVSSENYKTLSKKPKDSSMSTRKIEEAMSISPTGWRGELEHMLNNLQVL